MNAMLTFRSVNKNMHSTESAVSENEIVGGVQSGLAGSDSIWLGQTSPSHAKRLLYMISLGFSTGWFT